MRKKIEIVVITECRLIQIGIESMLSTETDINLLATVTTAQVLSSEHEPDMALLYQKPALEALALLRTHRPALNVLVLNCCFDASSKVLLLLLGH